MPEPVFTLEHEEQTWRILLPTMYGDKAIYLTRYGTGKITIKPFPPGSDEFRFIKSTPEMVLAIGRLLIAAAQKAGASDA